MPFFTPFFISCLLLDTKTISPHRRFVNFYFPYRALLPRNAAIPLLKSPIFSHQKSTLPSAFCIYEKEDYSFAILPSSIANTLSVAKATLLSCIASMAVIAVAKTAMTNNATSKMLLHLLVLFISSSFSFGYI